MIPLPQNVNCNQLFPTLLVGDIETAIDIYTNQLGFSHLFTWGDPASYAGVNFGKTTIHLAKASGYVTGHSEVNFIVDDADALFHFHKANGAEVITPIADREYGIRDYNIKDPYGNYLGFGHYIYHQGEPIKIDRVDVPVRLEKRLAALVYDLAAYKKMDISSFLEETLLHSFEPLGEGVASPHNLSTLDYIVELKKKHGIDYDSHGSYRFVE